MHFPTVQVTLCEFGNRRKYDRQNTDIGIKYIVMKTNGGLKKKKK